MVVGLAKHASAIVDRLVDGGFSGIMRVVHRYSRGQRDGVVGT